MNGGAVESKDLFPPKDIYEEKSTPVEKKIPVEDLANALSLQEEDVAVIIIKKRAVGGYLVKNARVSGLSKHDLKTSLNLAWGRTLNFFLAELKKE